MKRTISEICGFVAAFSLLSVCNSCKMLGEDADEGAGRLCLCFEEGTELLTRAYLNLPDTSDFILTVRDVSGNAIYNGKYGDCPEVMELMPGTYDVKVVSGDFSKPAFDAPLFGDEQCVIVKEGEQSNVRLICTQLNAGISLDISSDFLTEYPDAVIFLKSSDGKLMYSYSEKRAAYFLPGLVSMVVSSGEQEEIVLVKDVQARQMLRLRVEVASVGGASGREIYMEVDTSRVWIDESCTIGSDCSGTTSVDALSIAQAMVSAGMDDVWVCGYIVGGDLTSANASFDAPFESKTCVLLGPRSSTRDRMSCVAVQLPAGDVRDNLNLVDNESLLGRRVCVKGDIVDKYYGIPGVKNTSEYEFQDVSEL